MSARPDVLPPNADSLRRRRAVNRLMEAIATLAAFAAVGVLAIMVVSVALWVIERVVGVTNPRAVMGMLTAVSLLLAYVVFFLLDRGMVVSGSYRQTARPAPGAGAA